MKINVDGLAHALKILGGVVKETIDVGDYRITVIVERKIDEKIGVVIENIVIERRSRRLDITAIIQRIKDAINDM